MFIEVCVSCRKAYLPLLVYNMSKLKERMTLTHKRVEITLDHHFWPIEKSVDILAILY